MHAAEVVVREVQCDCHPEIEQLLAESVRQARESADRHTHREILPLYIASRNVVRIGITATDLGYDLHDWGWGVPPLGVGELAVIEHLYDLSEVHVQTKCFRNGSPIVLKSISR